MRADLCGDVRAAGLRMRYATEGDRFTVVGSVFGIIIFGTKPVERSVGSGSFHCPTCQSDAPYNQRRIRQVFTLYFIPVFPLGSGTELIRCGRCGSEYPSDVLQWGHDQARSASSPWTCRSCGNTNPPEYARCVACQNARNH